MFCSMGKVIVFTQLWHHVVSHIIVKLFPFISLWKYIENYDDVLIYSLKFMYSLKEGVGTWYTTPAKLENRKYSYRFEEKNMEEIHNNGMLNVYIV